MSQAQKRKRADEDVESAVANQSTQSKSSSPASSKKTKKRKVASEKSEGLGNPDSAPLENGTLQVNGKSRASKSKQRKSISQSSKTSNAEADSIAAEEGPRNSLLANAPEAAQKAPHDKPTKRKEKKKGKRRNEANSISEGGTILDGLQDDSTIALESFEPIRAKKVPSAISKIEEAQTAISQAENNRPERLLGNVKNKLLVRQGNKQWKLSPSIAGNYTTHKPLFVGKKNQFLVPTGSYLLLCSNASGENARKLPIYRDAVNPARISSFTPSALHANIVFVATLDSKIHRLDWKTGDVISSGKMKSQVHRLTTVVLKGENHNEEVLITVEDCFTNTGRQQSIIKAYQSTGDLAIEEPLIIKDKDSKVFQLESDPATGIILVSSGKILWVGSPNFNGAKKFYNMRYKWFPVNLSNRVTAFASRVSVPLSSSSSRSKTSPCLDVAVGDDLGRINVYYDLLPKLERGSSSSRPGPILPRVLHWHRKPVETIRWTLDGLYLLSGGSEMTLVSWQISTGRNNFLPHLPATIRDITISPAGDRLAISLGDNSIIVLTNIEYEVKTMIAGMQAMQWDYPTNIRPDGLPSALSSSRTPPSQTFLFLRVPSVIRNPDPKHLLTVVPSTKHRVEAGQGAPHLQTYDFKAGRHISKQEIARTNLTVKNVSGEYDDIGEPTVYLMKTSHDGQWLATIEHWKPAYSRLDEEPKTNDHMDIAQQAEISLNFWAWAESTGRWELDTKILSPHTSHGDSTQPRQILDLTSNPLVCEFSTLGDDGTLKIWNPKHSGQRSSALSLTSSEPKPSKKVVKNSEYPGATSSNSWSLRLSVLLPQPVALDDLSVHDDGHAGAIAYSEDGSALAAAFTASNSTTSSSVYFIDAQTGSIRHTAVGAISGTPQAFVFLGRYLVSLSSVLLIWDVVTDTEYARLTKLSSENDLPGYPRAAMHLAANSRARTFAVAMPISENGELFGGHISVYTVDNGQSCFQAILERPVTALLSIPKSDGFLILDSAAEIRTLIPVKETTLENDEVSTKTKKGEKMEEMTKALRDYTKANERDIEAEQASGLQKLGISGGGMVRQDTPHDLEGDGMPVVALEQIRDIFDVAGGVTALPSVSSMYERVFSLFSSGRS